MRSIAEAMLFRSRNRSAFNGVDVLPQTFASSLTKALTQDVMAAIILFTVMASIMTQTGIITRLVSILNSILGRFRGGPAYVSACASAMFGMVSGRQQRQRRYRWFYYNPVDDGVRLA